MTSSLAPHPQPTKHPAQVAVVTGAAGGLGQQFAQALVQRGFEVILVDSADCTAVLTRIAQSGGSGHYYACDLSQVEQIQQLIQKILANHGHCEV